MNELTLSGTCPFIQSGFHSFFSFSHCISLDCRICMWTHLTYPTAPLISSEMGWLHEPTLMEVDEWARGRQHYSQILFCSEHYHPRVCTNTHAEEHCGYLNSWIPKTDDHHLTRQKYMSPMLSVGSVYGVVIYGNMVILWKICLPVEDSLSLLLPCWCLMLLFVESSTAENVTADTADCDSESQKQHRSCFTLWHVKARMVYRQVDGLGLVLRYLYADNPSSNLPCNPRSDTCESFKCIEGNGTQKSWPGICILGVIRSMSSKRWFKKDWFWIRFLSLVFSLSRSVSLCVCVFIWLCTD